MSQPTYHEHGKWDVKRVFGFGTWHVSREVPCKLYTRAQCRFSTHCLIPTFIGHNARTLYKPHLPLQIQRERYNISFSYILYYKLQAPKPPCICSTQDLVYDLGSTSLHVPAIQLWPGLGLLITAIKKSMLQAPCIHKDSVSHDIIIYKISSGHTYLGLHIGWF